MYKHAQDIGITLLTVSHRPSLWKYHQYVLQFDGQGNLELIPLEKNHRMSLEQEKADLELKISEVSNMQERLKVVNDALQRRSIDLVDAEA